MENSRMWMSLELISFDSIPDQEEPVIQQNVGRPIHVDTDFASERPCLELSFTKTNNLTTAVIF